MKKAECDVAREHRKQQSKFAMCLNGDFKCKGPLAFCKTQEEVCHGVTEVQFSTDKAISWCHGDRFSCRGPLPWCNKKHEGCRQSAAVALPDTNLTSFHSSCSGKIFSCSGSVDFCGQKLGDCYDAWQEGPLALAVTSAESVPSYKLKRIVSMIGETKLAARAFEICGATGNQAEAKRQACKGWCSTDSSTWQEKCSWRLSCGGCSQCRRAVLFEGRSNITSNSSIALEGVNLAPCHAKMPATAKIGDHAVNIALESSIAGNGSFIAKQCVQVDPKYYGTVWLVCTDGKLAVTANCFRQHPNTTKKCQETSQELQHTFTTTWVELARLVSTYEKLTKSSDCSDETAMEFSTKQQALSMEANRISKMVEEKVSVLRNSLRPSLQNAKEAEEKLQEHVDKVAQECKDLPETKNDLKNVREAIHALKSCTDQNPGPLSLPRWTGSLVTGSLGHLSASDVAAVDNALNDLCVSSSQAPGKGYAVRAAEVSEIVWGDIEDMPNKNTANVPLLGRCPFCQEKNMERVCWIPQQRFNIRGNPGNCNLDNVAVLCVIEPRSIV
eukprot:TRINITY_DN16185_c0_g2_i1.p1 TRINITY_DN16185_c0_g2~~TRINITY_DN16185_c0_g2_i1.p1  ORF type:complete len:641 (+),score=108.44 TRINITY_DN16185_c0_g2_i1:259-1923(+)